MKKKAVFIVFLLNNALHALMCTLISVLLLACLSLPFLSSTTCHYQLLITLKFDKLCLLTINHSTLLHCVSLQCSLSRNSLCLMPSFQLLESVPANAETIEPEAPTAIKEIDIGVAHL